MRNSNKNTELLNTTNRTTHKHTNTSTLKTIQATWGIRKDRRHRSVRPVDSIRAPRLLPAAAAPQGRVGRSRHWQLHFNQLRQLTLRKDDAARAYTVDPAFSGSRCARGFAPLDA
jgi:hypothetical protein